MHHAIIWLLSVELLGLAVLPLAYALFRRLPDRGLVLSKVLALLLVSYLLWVLGTAHILPNTQYSVIGIALVLAGLSYGLMRRRLPDLVAFVKAERLPLLAAEAVFLALFALWVAIVYHTPAINHTEKPMDFAFLNAILKSTHFPPEDPWLSGHSISYYYFGHFIMAALTKLTAIPSNVSYNLSIALLPALAGAGAFSLVYNLVRRSGADAPRAVLFALAAPLFLVLISNLEGVLELVQARDWGSEGFWGWVSIKGLATSSTEGGLFPGDHLWWWRATRVIDTVRDGISLDYTITEFPFFSFVLGDLHPHASSLPFLVLNLALALNLLGSRSRIGPSWLLQRPWETAAITLSLGALAFINIWDLPVFAAILAVTVLAKSYGDRSGDVAGTLLSTASFMAPVVVGAVLLYLPFYMTLDSQASGILPTRDAMATRPFFFFLIWGLFLLAGGYFLLAQLAFSGSLARRNVGTLGVALAVAVFPFVLWACIKIVVSPFEGGVVDALGTVGSRLGKLLPGMAIVALALAGVLSRMKEGNGTAAVFPLLMLGIAFYLLLGAELFYLVDLFGTRMNTVFKTYYQAWLLLAVVSAYGLYYGCANPLPSLGGMRGRLSRLAPLAEGARRMTPGIWLGLVGALTLASLYYPVGAALDRAGQSREATLDGLAFLREHQAGEYEAITWLRDEAPRGRIVEAVGGSYTDHGRISSSTGLPTILGWPGHEHQWRGSTREFDGREGDVERIYTADDSATVHRLLETYDVRYVYVGARERARYGPDRFGTFHSFLTPVFHSPNVVIYERAQTESPGLVKTHRADAG